MTHDRLGRTLPVVRDIEVALGVIEQRLLALLDFEIFPYRDDSIRFLAHRRLIVELRDVFALQLDVRKSALHDNSFLHGFVMSLLPELGTMGSNEGGRRATGVLYSLTVTTRTPE